MPVLAPPPDELFSSQWYLQTMKVPQAWQLLANLPDPKPYGSAAIRIGILDQGIKSNLVNGDLVCTHPDLSGRMANGLHKLAAFYDFSTDSNDAYRVVENNNQVSNDHGMNCAGIAAANISLASKTGMVGVAPGCRLVGGKRSEQVGENFMVTQLFTMAGFTKTTITNWDNYEYKYIPNRGCDIINCSFNWAYPDPENDPADRVRKISTILTREGRNGKGTLLIVAAGNNGENISLLNKLPKYTNCIVVGASTINPVSGLETFASYSNNSDEDARVDVCAPSSFDITNVDNATINGIITTTLEMQGNTGTGNNYINNFGGTSAAAPMVAGVVALMLTANPNLTALQVKKILQETADVIDRNNTDPRARWYTLPAEPNKRPDVYSNVCGYGRVNAEKAVQRAIDMRV